MPLKKLIVVSNRIQFHRTCFSASNGPGTASIDYSQTWIKFFLIVPKLWWEPLPCTARIILIPYMWRQLFEIRQLVVTKRKEISQFKRLYSCRPFQRIFWSPSHIGIQLNNWPRNWSAVQRRFAEKENQKFTSFLVGCKSKLAQGIGNSSNLVRNACVGEVFGAACHRAILWAYALWKERNCTFLSNYLDVLISRN